MGNEVVVIDPEIKELLNKHRFKLMAELTQGVTLKRLLSVIIEVYLEDEQFQDKVRAILESSSQDSILST